MDGYLNAGDHILIRLGDRRNGGPGTRVQTFVEDGFRFRCYVDPLGDFAFRRGAGRRGDRRRRGSAGVPVSLRVSLQDRWGNVCQQPGGRLLVAIHTVGGEVEQRELVVPDTGWATAGLDALMLPEGTHRIVVTLAGAADVPATAVHVTVGGEFPATRGYFADLHVHAHDTVGTNSPAYNAAYARDIGGIDVLGYTANDFQITDANWKLGVEAVEAYNEPGRFVAYAVQEWCGSSTAGGDHNVVFLGDRRPTSRTTRAASTTAPWSGTKTCAAARSTSGAGRSRNCGTPMSTRPPITS